MNLIYQLLFSPASRAVGAFVVGVVMVIHWWWNYREYKYLPSDVSWQRNSPYEFYCGIFLILVGVAGCAVVYWLRLRRSAKTANPSR